MRCSSARFPRFFLLLAGSLALPLQALADWGENWGTMFWQSSTTPVPGLDVLGVGVLVALLMAASAGVLRKWRPASGLPLLLVVLAIPLAVVAGTLTVPNDFVNGTQADADQVNANFDAVETAVNDNDARITTAQSAADAAAAGHTTNTDTQLTNAQVAAAAAAEGFVTGAHTINTDNQLSEAQVLTFVANNGYGLAVDISANSTVNSTQSGDIAALQAQIGDLQNKVDALHGFIPRFQACADGVTVADRATGLLWERKTGIYRLGDPNFCVTSSSCPNPNDLNNVYAWSLSGSTAPDGLANTDFLTRLNTNNFAGHTGWRLPVISELQSIMIGPGVTTVANADPTDPMSGTNVTGQSTTCGSGPCIDPGFAAVGGPTAPHGYWSMSTVASNAANAWGAMFGEGALDSSGPKATVAPVRAVRAGSCTN